MKTRLLLLSSFIALSVGHIWADVAIDETNFPDQKFRNYLLSQDYGADGNLTAEEIAGVTNLKLDLSKNTALETIICNNKLTTLVLPKNEGLSWLMISANRIKDEAMDAIVAILPTTTDGLIYAIFNQDEQNVMTTTKGRRRVRHRHVPVSKNFAKSLQLSEIFPIFAP